MKDQNGREPANGLLTEILCGYQLRLDSGEPIDRDALIGRHPELADELRSYFDDEDLIDEVIAHSTVDQADHSTRTSAPSDLPGLEVKDHIGSGGMGIVYRAHQRSLNRDVAVKMIYSAATTSEMLTRFCNECEAVSRLQHPHVIEIFDRGDRDGRLFFTMEYMRGGSLADKLAQQPMSQEAAAELIGTLAEATHYCHTNNVMHRDLKPSNILFTEAGAPKLSDFGLAKIFDDDGGEEITLSHQVLGTPNYMAPEQARGKVVGRQSLVKADIYALGAVLYRILADQPPFSGTTREATLEQVRFRQVQNPSRIKRGLCRTLEAICMKCLARSPDQRYTSALELAQDLRHWQAKKKTIAGGERTARRLTRAVGCTLAVVIVLAAAGGAAMFLQPSYVHYSINSRLESQRSVTLLPATGKPRWHQLLATKPDAQVSFPTDGPCLLSAKDAVVLFMLRDFKHERFRITAEIRHDEEFGVDGGVGLFIARDAALEEGQQPRGCLVRYSDHDSELTAWKIFNEHASGQGFPIPPFMGNRLTLYGYTMLADAKIDYSGSHFFTPDPHHRWRTLGLEVQPDVIYVNWEGRQQVLQLSAEEMRGPQEASEAVSELRSRRLSLGIYVRSGTAAFRNVTVDLLDQKPRVIDRLGQ